MTSLYRIWHWWLNTRGNERVMIILQLVGVIVVFAYTTVAALQWCQMKKTARSTRVAAYAAKESADSAAASVRAWLVITQTDVQVEQIDNNPPDSRIPVG